VKTEKTKAVNSRNSLSVSSADGGKITADNSTQYNGNCRLLIKYDVVTCQSISQELQHIKLCNH